MSVNQWNKPNRNREDVTSGKDSTFRRSLTKDGSDRDGKWSMRCSNGKMDNRPGTNQMSRGYKINFDILFAKAHNRFIFRPDANSDMFRTQTNFQKDKWGQFRRKTLQEFPFRPTERLRKGQNQLILERLQERQQSASKEKLFQTRSIINYKPKEKMEEFLNPPEKKRMHQIKPIENTNAFEVYSHATTPRGKTAEIVSDPIPINTNSDSPQTESIPIEIPVESKDQTIKFCKTYLIDEKEENKLPNITLQMEEKPKPCSTKQIEPEINFKPEEINIQHVIKRVMENNRKEAAVKQKDFLSDFGKGFAKNLNNMNNTHARFFTAGKEETNRNSRPFSEASSRLKCNSIEILLQDPVTWRKHEEIWGNIALLSMSTDLEKYLIPPNDFDVLVSAYCKVTNKHFTSSAKVVVDKTVSNPRTEIKNWKTAYKNVVMRWHPDKLFPVLNEIKLKDESLRNLLKKKSNVVINNMNCLFQNVVEILRKIEHEKVQ